MKFSNIDKATRNSAWTRVRMPPGSVVKRWEIKIWLQQQSSTGGYYHYYGGDSYWFELSQDAAMFALRWT